MALSDSDQIALGLAVYPTWLVVREIEPVEERRDDAVGGEDAPEKGLNKGETVDRLTNLDLSDKSVAKPSSGKE